MRPRHPAAPDDANVESLERAAWMLSTLRAAVARACPANLAAHREDLVQVALLRVLQHERADEQNRVRTASYLWRVAFSVTATELRKRRSEARLSKESATMEEGSGPSPELRLALRDCLARLAEPRQMAVLLHLQGFKAEEASQVLHWNVKRVQNLLYRGLADLRACLERKGLVR